VTLPLRACPRCRALYDTALPDCPECGQSIRPKLARERGGWFDRIAARGFTAVRLLIVLNVVLYGVSLLLTGKIGRGGGGIAGFGQISGLVVWSLGGLTHEGVVEDGEWWRLVCPVFLHFSLLHIIFNCYVIGWAGQLTETAYGSAKFLVFFILAGVAGSVTSLLYHGSGFWIGAGASGAGFGILALSAVHGLRTKDEVLRSFFVRWLILGLVLGFVVGADNAAHVGGLMAGGLLGLFSAGAARTRLSWRKVVLFDLAAILALALVGASFAAMLLWRGRLSG
jgi:rhomboid protease GluP